MTGLGIVSVLKLETTAQTLTNSRTQRAKLEVSQLTGIPANQLTIVTEAALADTGITRFKMTDSQGKIYGISLDATGNPVPTETLAQAIKAIENRGFVGKLEAELANLLEQGSNTPINVIFWLKDEAVTPFRGKTPAERQAYLDQLRVRQDQVQQPLVNQLKTNGQQVMHQSAYAPIVGAAVTPAVIKALANRPDVERIYLSRVGSPRADVSQVVVQANAVNSRGLTGTEQTVGVVERGRIGTYPPQLLKVFPLEESTQPHVQSIGAALNFRLGEGGDLGSLHLFVDGVDVTSQARIANTRDSPASNVEISYTPNFSEPDTHCAEVRFETLEGRTNSYNWCFSVKPSSVQ